MAKWKNLAPGTRVMVKEVEKLHPDEAGFLHQYAGMIGTVVEREPKDYQGLLNIEVKFDLNGHHDWGTNDEVRLLEDDE